MYKAIATENNCRVDQIHIFNSFMTASAPGPLFVTKNIGQNKNVTYTNLLNHDLEDDSIPTVNNFLYIYRCIKLLVVKFCIW